ncbi:MAG TPA: TetR/AcrR family transcriptional regulator [Thermoleophilaceae bacterium]|nr:TetR/AcrR family transcriptional regulator [Thermoleophilaceae bacterium]
MGIDKRDPSSRDGRARLLDGAGSLLAERGYAAMELRHVAERGNAPRGSIYHHFPGGKAQLAAEAAELDGIRTRAAIEESIAKHGLKKTLRRFGDFFRRRAADHPGLIGCPVAAAALARPEDPALAAAATASFKSWEEVIAAELVEEGASAADAAAFAAVTVSTIEGALLRTRAAGNHEPLDLAIAGLETALDNLLARLG